jgi:hypothetical protein
MRSSTVLAGTRKTASRSARSISLQTALQRQRCAPTNSDCGLLQWLTSYCVRFAVSARTHRIGRSHLRNHSPQAAQDRCTGQQEHSPHQGCHANGLPHCRHLGGRSKTPLGGRKLDCAPADQQSLPVHLKANRRSRKHRPECAIGAR